MKKVLLILVIGILVASAASYFGMQWKVRSSVDDFFSSIPMVDASYDSANVGLDGKLAINGIDIFIPLAQTDLSISSLKIDTGGLMNSMRLEQDLKDGKLPDQLKLIIDTFSMDINPDFFSAMGQGGQNDLFSEAMAFGCGRKTVLGPQEFFDMGFRNLTFDLEVGYESDSVSDMLISTIDFYLDGIANITLDQTIMGMSGIINNYQSAMFGFDPRSISTTEVQVQYVDLGYNAKYADYCGRAAGVEKQEWQELNLSMVAAMLDDIDFESNFDVLNVYSQLRSERARVDLKLRPIAGFTAADLQLYSMSDMIQMLDLRLTVNDAPVDIQEVSWDQGKWSKLKTADIRREFRVTTEEEILAEAEKEKESVRKLERILREVPTRQLEQYLHRSVQITRKDGKVFAGELTSVTEKRVTVRTRMNSGYTDLPLMRQDIAVSKLYPEN